MREGGEGRKGGRKGRRDGGRERVGSEGGRERGILQGTPPEEDTGQYTKQPTTRPLPLIRAYFGIIN